MNLAAMAFPLARPLLHALDAETAHRLTIAALTHIPNRDAAASDPRLAVEAFGLRFPNPLGLAAGFDKNAEVADAMLGLGFGFVPATPLSPPGGQGRHQPHGIQQ